MKKLYRLFNLEDVMERPLYYPNLHAITGEDLHSKMEIAAELTHRDMLMNRPGLAGRHGDFMDLP